MPSLIERAPVELNKQIRYDRPWTTLFCPIEKDQRPIEKDQLFANLYVDTDDNFATLQCATPSNDKSFYTETMKRM